MVPERILSFTWRLGRMIEQMRRMRTESLVGTEKPKLVYIASSGRSGSTVLELLLGAHSACWTLGEFHVLPWLLRTNVKPCGCGSPVAQCPFWQSITEDCRKELLHGSITRFRASCWAD